MPVPKRRPRKYGPAVFKLLGRIWTLCREPCGKYLAPILADELERLERFGELGALSGLLNALWELVNLHKNHLLPMVKPNGYATARSGRRKQTYDKPRTRAKTRAQSADALFGEQIS